MATRGVTTRPASRDRVVVQGPNGGSMSEDAELAALVNVLEQAKVAIQETLDAIEREHPDLEVSGYAFQPATFYLPTLKPGLMRNLPGSVRPGLADVDTNLGCYNPTCTA